jgi:hypothetical protein
VMLVKVLHGRVERRRGHRHRVIGAVIVAHIGGRRRVTVIAWQATSDAGVVARKQYLHHWPAEVPRLTLSQDESIRRSAPLVARGVDRSA